VGAPGRPESRFKVTRGTCELLLTVAPFRAWRGSGVRIARGSNRLSRRLRPAPTCSIAGESYPTGAAGVNESGEPSTSLT